MHQFVIMPLVSGKKQLNELFEQGWRLLPETFKIIPDYPRAEKPDEGGRVPRIHVITAVVERE